MNNQMPCKRGLQITQKCKKLADQLARVRFELAPVVNRILRKSSYSQDEDKHRLKCSLSRDQLDNIILASSILNELEYTMFSSEKNSGKIFANTNFIVQNVTVDHSQILKDEDKVTIDGATVVELLDLYERMGLVIRRIITEYNVIEDDNDRFFGDSSEDDEMQRTMRPQVKSETESETESFAGDGVRGNTTDTEDEDEEVTKTNSSMFTSSGEEPRYSKNGIKSKSELHIKLADEPKISEEDKNVPAIFIKIKCYTDGGVSESDSNEEVNSGGVGNKNKKSDGTSHVHVKLDGKPITLKFNTDEIGESGAYCIDAGTLKDAGMKSNIQIVIKECPDCCSTVIGSSNELDCESVTLHNRCGDGEENAKNVKSGEQLWDEMVERLGSHHKIPRPVHEPISRLNVREEPSFLVCGDKKTCMCDNKHGMDVFLDVQDVGNSKVNRRICKMKSEEEHLQRGIVCKCSKPGRKKNVVSSSLMDRKKVCSSQEFDVSSAASRLRKEGISHPNPGIVVHLKQIGVNQILRACRPAKCCRKAILNERQKVGLPYAVSLRSLPLDERDLPIIDQSIDMSVRKIKNSTDLRNDYNDKLTYYVNLGREDFKPNINFPWVVPIYAIKLYKDYNNPAVICSEKSDNCFVLKKPKSSQTENRCVVTKKHSPPGAGKSKPAVKYYILKKIKKSSHTETSNSINFKIKHRKTLNLEPPKICRTESKTTTETSSQSSRESMGTSSCLEHVLESACVGFEDEKIDPEMGEFLNRLPFKPQKVFCVQTMQICDIRHTKSKPEIAFPVNLRNTRVTFEKNAKSRKTSPRNREYQGAFCGFTGDYSRKKSTPRKPPSADETEKRMKRYFEILRYLYPKNQPSENPAVKNSRRHHSDTKILLKKHRQSLRAIAAKIPRRQKYLERISNALALAKLKRTKTRVIKPKPHLEYLLKMVGDDFTWCQLAPFVPQTSQHLPKKKSIFIKENTKNLPDGINENVLLENNKSGRRKSVAKVKTGESLNGNKKSGKIGNSKKNLHVSNTSNDVKCLFVAKHFIREKIKKKQSKNTVEKVEEIKTPETKFIANILRQNRESSISKNLTPQIHFFAPIVNAYNPYIPQRQKVDNNKDILALKHRESVIEELTSASMILADSQLKKRHIENVYEMSSNVKIERKKTEEDIESSVSSSKRFSISRLVNKSKKKCLTKKTSTSLNEIAEPILSIHQTSQNEGNELKKVKLKISRKSTMKNSSSVEMNSVKSFVKKKIRFYKAKKNQLKDKVL